MKRAEVPIVPERPAASECMAQQYVEFAVAKPFETGLSVPLSLDVEEWKTINACRFAEAQKQYIPKEGADGLVAAEFVAGPGSARRPT